MAAIDHRERQRASELAWINYARSHLPETLPVGDVRQLEPPAPDIIIDAARGSIGIEISQIFPRSVGSFTDAEIESAQRTAVKDAQALYTRRYGDGLFVNFSFREGVLPARRDLVEAMVGLVARNKPAEGESFSAHVVQRDLSRSLPTWLSQISISPQLDCMYSDWEGASCWSGEPLQREQVQKRIDEKALLLSGYQTFADAVWLLLVCDDFSTSTDMEIPTDAWQWCFQHPFDRVVVMSRQVAFRY